jgi:calpain-15
VKSLFVTNEYKKNGVYRLRLNKNGIWQEFTIDDYMPCELEGLPMYTRNNFDELWVMLLEKAYAKLHGGY